MEATLEGWRYTIKLLYVTAWVCQFAWIPSGDVILE